RSTCRRSLLREALRDVRRHVVERTRRLRAQRLPAGEVLLERLGAWRREGHPLTFEGESWAAARERGILAPELLDEIARLLQLTRGFLLQTSTFRAFARL